MYRIDELLQEALSPTQEMSDELRARVLTRVSERKEQTMENHKKNRWRVWKPAMVAVACAALILGATMVPDLFEKNTIQENGGSTVTSSPVGNSFTIKALAATKEMKKEASLAVDQNDGQFVCGTPAENGIGGTILFPILCEGSNIEKITYSVNKGGFVVTHKKGDGYVVDGKRINDANYLGVRKPKSLQPFSDRIYESIIETSNKENNDEDSPIVKKAKQDYEKEKKKYEETPYSSFSVSPDFQESDDTSISFYYDETVSKSIYDQIMDSAILLDEDVGSELTEAERDKQANLFAEGLNEIYDRIKITCTATFKDGSKKSIDVAVHAKAMTPEEAKALNGWSFDKKHVYPVYSVI